MFRGKAIDFVYIKYKLGVGGFSYVFMGVGWFIFVCMKGSWIYFFIRLANISDTPHHHQY